MTIIKVGLDQWIIVNTEKKVDLNTNGLTGCVALALISNKQAFLAHVYSDCTEKTWDEYKKNLDIAFNFIYMDEKSSPVEASLVYSENKSTWLSTKLKAWLKDKGIDDKKISTCSEFSGCRLSYSEVMKTWDIMMFEDDEKSCYIDTTKYKKASEASDSIYKLGKLSTFGNDAD